MGEVVLAIDPGKMTGFWCYQPLLMHLADGGQLPQWTFVDMLDEWAEKWAGAHRVQLVCESFTVTQRSMTQRGDRLWSVEQIGIVQFIARKQGFAYVEQSPSDAKNFVTDVKLKRVGWYKPGMEHSRDAARHALLYATRQGHIDPKVLLEGWG